MGNKKLSFRSFRLLVLIAFIANTFLATAGAHYDVGFSHLIDGTKEHKHQSSFHFSESYDINDVNIYQTRSITAPTEALSLDDKYSACHSAHIHLSNLCIDSKSVDHSQYDISKKTEINKAPLQAVFNNTYSFAYLPPSLQLASSRSPPLL